MKEDRALLLLPPVTFKFMTKRSTGKTKLRVIGHFGGLLRGMGQPEWDFAADAETGKSKYKEARLDGYRRTVARALRALGPKRVDKRMLKSVSMKTPEGAYVFA